MAIDQVATNAFKANPIGFLRNALVLAPTFNAERHNRSQHLGLEAPEDWQGWTAVLSPMGTVIPLYKIVRSNPGEAYFRSYIADYQQGATTFTTLGSNPHSQFCFTANMNGCTFGIGQPQPDGKLVVSHGNAANATGITNIPTYLKPETKTALQVATQYTRAKEGHVGGGRVFEPSHYRIGARQSVTFGYRPVGAPWQFHYISYIRGNGGAYTSYGVGPIMTNHLA